MKKSILFACLLAAICAFQTNKVQAQKGGEAAAVGDNVVNLGVGLLGGYSYSGYSGISETPAFPAYYELVFKELGPGKLGLGGGLEYKSLSYNYSFGGYTAS